MKTFFDFLIDNTSLSSWSKNLFFTVLNFTLFICSSNSLSNYRSIFKRYISIDLMYLIHCPHELPTSFFKSEVLLFLLRWFLYSFSIVKGMFFIVILFHRKTNTIDLIPFWVNSKLDVVKALDNKGASNQ